MLLQMQAELLYFALSMAAGAAAALLGNGVKRLHRRRRLVVWLGILDLLYWFLLGFALFLLCYYRNSGIFRGYAVVGTLLGYGIFQALWYAVWHAVGKRIKKRIARKEEKG